MKWTILRRTEMSSWFSEFKVGTIITDSAEIVFAFLVDNILTRILIHLLPALTILVPKK